MNKNKFNGFAWLLPLAVVALIGSQPVQAAMIISAAPASMIVAAGTSGASFDITLQNTGAAAQNIAGFSLGISVADPHLSFTGANMSTALTYIFNGDSFAAAFPPFATTLTASLIEASDLSNSGAGTSVAAGATIGLAHIIFNLAGNTSAGPISIVVAQDCSVTSDCTSLSDQAGANVTFTARGETINVTTATGIPEPSTFLLALGALPVILWKRRKSS
jgi:hypothetical protein